MRVVGLVVCVSGVVVGCGGSSDATSSTPGTAAGGTTSAAGGAAGKSGIGGASGKAGSGATSGGGSSGSGGSSGGSGSSGSGGSGGSSGSSGSGGSSGSSGSSGSGGSSGSSGSSGGPLGCSADLHSIVDAAGKKISDCPADQGCAGGSCVSACAAASAAGANLGCGFMLSTPRTYVGGAAMNEPNTQPCFAAFLANTWGAPALVTVQRGGKSYDATTFGRIADSAKPPAMWAPIPASGIPVGQVGVLFLSSDPNATLMETGEPLTCPVPPAIGAATEVKGTDVGEAFVIGASVPVSAYDIFPFGGAHSHFPAAQLLFPTSAWGKDFVMIAAPFGSYAADGPLFGQIIATVDATHVSISPSVSLPAGGGFPAMPKGQASTFTLAKGQVLQWQLPAGSKDMSGSIVEADQPIAAIGGSQLFRLQPLGDGPGGETTHTPTPAVATLGNDYVLAPYETRRADLVEETIVYRLVGALDGTILTFDPPVPGAPASIARGEVVDFSAVGAFRVTSQGNTHPFAIAQTMSSANVPGGSRPGALIPFPGLPAGQSPPLGDEDFVVTLAPSQFLSNYVFFTDPTYATTSLVVTRVRPSGGAFTDVTIDCLGVVSGWKDIGVSGLYQFARVDLVRAGVPVGTCANGPHGAKSAGAFGLVVWGLDTYSSYGYFAGGNAAKLNDQELKP